MDDFPVSQLFLWAGVIFVFCMAVALLIGSFLSEDKETGIIRQMWHTFFGELSDDE